MSFDSTTRYNPEDCQAGFDIYWKDFFGFTKLNRSYWNIPCIDARRYLMIAGTHTHRLGVRNLIMQYPNGFTSEETYEQPIPIAAARVDMFLNSPESLKAGTRGDYDRWLEQVKKRQEDYMRENDALRCFAIHNEQTPRDIFS